MDGFSGFSIEFDNPLTENLVMEMLAKPSRHVDLDQVHDGGAIRFGDEEPIRFENGEHLGKIMLHRSLEGGAR